MPYERRKKRRNYKRLNNKIEIGIQSNALITKSMLLYDYKQ